MVAGAVGRLGGVCGEREGRDGTTMAATSIRGNPRRTVLQGINILLSEGVGLPIDLAHGWPGVVALSSGREIAADGCESANETSKDSNTKDGESGRVCDYSDEEAREIDTSENTYTGRKGHRHKEEQTQGLASNSSRGDDEEEYRSPNKPVGFTKVDGTGEADTKETCGDNYKDACRPNGASEPKSDGGKWVESGSIVGGTTEGFGDDLPSEDDKSEKVASSDPEVGLVGWRQLLEVRKITLGL